MRKLDYPALIAESVDELHKRERSEKQARLRLRVQLLRLLKNQETDSMKAACQICGITPKHGYDLWKKYRGKGLDALLRFDWKPRAAKLTPEQQAQLLERAATDNGFGSQAEAMDYLESEFAVSYTQGGVCLLFQRLKIKAKAPRPRNRQAVEEEQVEYKKTFSGE
ncbi:MAG: winged helix-turn-helix domain-containing protein [Acidobacteriota bacterium]|nr:winged helix-turn-helix domain-containing protein [Acidobacteriota bacterium]